MYAPTEVGEENALRRFLDSARIGCTFAKSLSDVEGTCADPGADPRSRRPYMRKRSAIVIGTTVAQRRGALGVQPGVVFSRALNRLAQRFVGGIALAAIALLAATPSASASGASLVRDINPGDGSFPVDTTNVGGTLFFTADDGTHGHELWRSDGTAAGTRLVRDIKPGAVDSYPYSPYDLTNVGGTLFFSADDGVHGYELWKAVP
jgi:ELWxxDGT repeat protein